MPSEQTFSRRSIVATNLVVRNVDEDLVVALKRQAASHGRSAEAEHREILRAALQRPKRRSLAEVLSSMPNVGEDTDFDCRKKIKRRPARVTLSKRDFAALTKALNGAFKPNPVLKGALAEAAAKVRRT
jgi:plasmid stability protein